MRMSSFDRWLTTEPTWRTASELSEVKKEDVMTTAKDGSIVPYYVELICHECGNDIGWCTDGEFNPYFTDDDETYHVCATCHPTIDEYTV